MYNFTFRRCTKWKKQQDLEVINVPKQGRPTTVTQEILDQMVLKAQQKDRAKDSFTKETLDDWLFDQLKREARKNGKNDHNVERVPSQTLRRYISKYLPEKCKAATQNERRFEALMDAVNHINFAAMWPAVVGSGDSTIPARNMFNLDATSILLEAGGDDKVRLVLAKGSTKELKEKGLNPSTTRTRTQASLKKRGISVVALTCADGSLTCVIVKIKDRNFEKVELRNVSSSFRFVLYGSFVLF